MKQWWQWLFTRTEADASAWGVVVWWERRRIPCNLVVGVAGLLSLALFLVFITASGILKPGEDAFEQMGLVLAPIVWNVCYTSGWIAELVLRPVLRRSPKIGPVLLGVGLAFSLLVIFFPSVFWGALLIWKSLRHIIS